MSDATILLIVGLISSTIITVVQLLTRRDVQSLRPEIVDVRDQLKKANEYIIAQGVIMDGMREELAAIKPLATVGTPKEQNTAIPPYGRAENPPPTKGGKGDTRQF